MKRFLNGYLLAYDVGNVWEDGGGVGVVECEPLISIMSKIHSIRTNCYFPGPAICRRRIERPDYSRVHLWGNAGVDCGDGDGDEDGVALAGSFLVPMGKIS